MIKRPIIPVVLCYCLGLLCAPWSAASLQYLFACFAVAATVTVVLFLGKKTVAASLTALTCFFLLGNIHIYPCFHPDFGPFHVARYADGRRVNIEGTLYRSPVMRQGGVRFYLKDLHLHTPKTTRSLSGRLMVTVRTAEKTYGYGDRIRFFCRVKKPANFSNPGGFDYVRYLSLKDIYATAFLRDDAGVVRTGRGYGNPLLVKTDVWRTRIRKQIDETVSDPAAAVLKALVLGDKGSIPREIRERFIRLGTAHLLAISGLHVGIVAFVAYLFFSLVFRINSSVLLRVNAFKGAVLLSAFPILFYCLIAGFQVPTVRAAIMILLYMTALLVNRRQDVMSTLFAAGLIILLLMPAAVFDISFLLSFTAVFFIVLLSPVFQEVFQGQEKDPFFEKEKKLRQGIGRWLGSSSAATAAAILGTAPLVIIFFHRFSFMGFLSNLFIVPVVGFAIIPPALLATLLFFCSPLTAGLLFKGTGRVLEGLLDFIHVWTEICSAEMLAAVPTPAETLCYYGLLLLLPVFVKRKKTVVFIITAAAVIAIFAAIDVYRVERKMPLRVTFLDVGSGDAALVEFPKGSVMLVDGGGFRDNAFDVGAAVVAPVLLQKRIKKVDYVVLSHPHMDHMGGLAYILAKFKINELWAGKASFAAPLFQPMVDAAKKRGAVCRVCSSETGPFVIDGVTISMLSPSESGGFTTGSYEDINNNSLVMKLVFNRVSFLLTGDITADAEARLVERSANLSATVLKVPHHGADGSSSAEFVKKVSPKLAVISCRRSGRKNGPGQRVLQTYRHNGAEILRTDRNGAVEVRTDGASYTVFCWKNR